jgi:fatty-acyl-CoA synthase
VKAKDGGVEAGETTCADDLIRWCSDRLARFKVPKEVRFVTAFPMTASGKVLKFRLREEHRG